jgi:TetR/AcrR family transcriptional repressor of nem operon
MARTREFDDATVVRAAREAFWDHGYVSTSLAQLQAATGLSKSSLYETYGSKRGLFERAARNYISEVMDPLLGPLEADGAGQAELVEYFLGLGRLVHATTSGVASRGCLMVTTVMELDELDAEAAELTGTFRQRIRAAVLHALESIDSIDDREAKADVLTAGQLGLVVTSRMNAAAAAALAETIAADIRRW